MPAGICCIHFHIYRSSCPGMFFKKVVLRIFRQFTGKHPCNSVTSTLLKSYFCMDILLWIYATYLQQNVYFRKHIWRTTYIYRSKYRGYKCGGSLWTSKKLFEIQFNIINTFSNFIRDFRLVVKGWFSEAVVVVDKIRKKGYV